MYTNDIYIITVGYIIHILYVIYLMIRVYTLSVYRRLIFILLHVYLSTKTQKTFYIQMGSPILVQAIGP